ncbi:MAG: hypothetical protein Q8755_03150, partial [Candidatus Phytoplasma australasiaticum]|nr:hypothetical protein [Candidatus Phytoplasma australasiaticum]
FKFIDKLLILRTNYDTKNCYNSFFHHVVVAFGVSGVTTIRSFFLFLVGLRATFLILPLVFFPLAFSASAISTFRSNSSSL